MRMLPGKHQDGSADKLTWKEAKQRVIATRNSLEDGPRLRQYMIDNDGFFQKVTHSHLFENDDENSTCTRKIIPPRPEGWEEEPYRPSKWAGRKKRGKKIPLRELYAQIDRMQESEPKEPYAPEVQVQPLLAKIRSWIRQLDVQPMRLLDHNIDMVIKAMIDAHIAATAIVDEANQKRSVFAKKAFSCIIENNLPTAAIISKQFDYCRLEVEEAWKSTPPKTNKPDGAQPKQKLRWDSKHQKYRVAPKYEEVFYLKVVESADSLDWRSETELCLSRRNLIGAMSRCRPYWNSYRFHKYDRYPSGALLVIINEVPKSALADYVRFLDAINPVDETLGVEVLKPPTWEGTMGFIFPGDYDLLKMAHEIGVRNYLQQPELVVPELPSFVSKAQFKPRPRGWAGVTTQVMHGNEREVSQHIKAKLEVDEIPKIRPWDGRAFGDAQRLAEVDYTCRLEKTREDLFKYISKGRNPKEFMDLVRAKVQSKTTQHKDDMKLIATNKDMTAARAGLMKQRDDLNHYLIATKMNEAAQKAGVRRPVPEQTHPTGFLDLPTEIRLLVYSYLPGLENVKVEILPLKTGLGLTSCTYNNTDKPSHHYKHHNGPGLAYSTYHNDYFREGDSTKITTKRRKQVLAAQEKQRALTQKATELAKPHDGDPCPCKFDGQSCPDCLNPIKYGLEVQKQLVFAAGGVVHWKNDPTYFGSGIFEFAMASKRTYQELIPTIYESVEFSIAQSELLNQFLAPLTPVVKYSITKLALYSIHELAPANKNAKFKAKENKNWKAACSLAANSLPNLRRLDYWIEINNQDDYGDWAHQHPELGIWRPTDFELEDLDKTKWWPALSAFAKCKNLKAVRLTVQPTEQYQVEETFISVLRDAIAGIVGIPDLQLEYDFGWMAEFETPEEERKREVADRPATPPPRPPTPVNTWNPFSR